MAASPLFRHSYRAKRCLVPADGFYEWQRLPDGRRQPHYITTADGSPLAFAGLWSAWSERTSEAPALLTCTILTTTPNAVTASIHDRMPVIIDPDGYDLWLDPGMQNVAAISELLKPYDAMLMRCYPVSNRVNHVGNDDVECSQPVEVAETQDRLFL